MTSILVATPVYGPATTASVSYAWHRKMLMLARDPNVDMADGFALNDDLVRARSRAVRMFLETKHTHLLFWDADVVPRHMFCVRAMLEADVDVIALPYPHKAIRWENIEAGVRDETEMTALGRQTAEEIEQLGYTYPINKVDGTPIVNGIAEVVYAPTGFMLIKRSCLEAMTKHYRDELEIDDTVDGVATPLVALFSLLRVGRTLLHEDYSFCERWRRLGGKIHIWMDPATHIGAHAFRGHISGIARR